MSTTIPTMSTAVSTPSETQPYHAPGPKGEAVSFSFTITFSRVVENGPGMEKIGEIAKEGFTDVDLESAKNKFEGTGALVDLVDLNSALPEGSDSFAHAAVLVVHEAATKCFQVDPQLIRRELIQLGEKWNVKKLMRGQVKNSNARRNLCITDTAQDADLINGKGTVVAWAELPELYKVRQQLANELGCKAEELHAEGNFYHQYKSGIGFHGDGERKIVIAMRFGAPLRLHYQAFQQSDPLGERITIDTLQEGDLYVMGDKATGNDWKLRKTVTWRHAAERFHAKKPVYCKTLETLKAGRVTQKRKLEEKQLQQSKKSKK